MYGKSICCKDAIVRNENGAEVCNCCGQVFSLPPEDNEKGCMNREKKKKLKDKLDELENLVENLHSENSEKYYSRDWPLAIRDKKLEIIRMVEECCENGS